jgi:acetyl esterase/lipase
MTDDRMSRRRALGVLGAAGAGIAGLVAAARSLGSPAPRAMVAAGTTREVEQYGDLPRQLGEWWLPPDAPDGLLPTVVLVHGGYWRANYDLTLENAVAADLAARGFLVWNVDYRPSSDPYPATFVDVAAAYDHLAAGRFADRIDGERVSVVGHSAGGHLALWLASRDNLPAGAPGAGRRGPAPAAVVAQAPVAALAEGARLGLGSGAVPALMGGVPDELPGRYAVSDPIALLPAAGATTCVHAAGDDLVPISQSESYVAAAGSAARLVTFPGGHFEHLDPSSEACEVMRAALAR